MVSTHAHRLALPLGAVGAAACVFLLARAVLLAPAADGVSMPRIAGDPAVAVRIDVPVPGEAPDRRAAVVAAPGPRKAAVEARREDAVTTAAAPTPAPPAPVLEDEVPVAIPELAPAPVPVPAPSPAPPPTPVPDTPVPAPVPVRPDTEQAVPWTPPVPAADVPSVPDPPGEAPVAELPQIDLPSVELGGATLPPPLG